MSLPDIGKLMAPAGKSSRTTFIARGLSPLHPELAARQAGRLVLRELSRLAGARKNFPFEAR